MKEIELNKYLDLIKEICNETNCLLPSKDFPNYGIKHLQWFTNNFNYINSTDDIYRLCGFIPRHNVTKNDCINAIYFMLKNGSDLNYNDFRNPTLRTVGIYWINKHFGSLNKMKKELGYSIKQDNMISREINSKEMFDGIFNDFKIKYIEKYGFYITTRGVNKLNHRLNHNMLYKYSKKYYHMTSGDFLKMHGFIVGKNGYGSEYKYEDGEIVKSSYEKLFSDFLRENGYIYNVDYFRDVKYKYILNIENMRNIDCDYYLKFNNVYLEIVGMLVGYKTISRAIECGHKTKRKINYIKTLEEKINLTKDLDNIKFILPCDITENNMKKLIKIN